MSDAAADELLDSMNAAYAALREDAAAWAEELKERSLWDSALMDGIESDRPVSGGEDTPA
jgi:hypothetical protein